MSVIRNTRFRIYVGYVDTVTNEIVYNGMTHYFVQSDGVIFDYPLNSENQAAALVTFALLCPEAITELNHVSEQAKKFVDRHYSRNELRKLGPMVIPDEGYVMSHISWFKNAETSHLERESPRPFYKKRG